MTGGNGRVCRCGNELVADAGVVARRRPGDGTTEPRASTLIARLHLLARSWDVDGAPCSAASRTLGVVLMPERHITVQRRMAASPGSVWALFADFPHLA